MAEDRPQIYLITPPAFDAAEFAPKLASVLDAHEVACIRLALASRDEYEIGRAADALREVSHARDVALVIETHLGLVERHGLDGVHFTDGARQIRAARKALGQDAIVGSHCGASRHEGMNAGEAGADYVCFGPVGETTLGTGTRAEHDLFQWWSEMIEVPVVAEGALNEALIAEFAPVTDWFALGEEIWREEDPSGALGRLIAAMS
ncbi:MAG: thiamine phosphate synthase [Rhodobacteraceae bacterium]|uniref:thiamine phosphate synthase n=1 Tax=Thioclava sp. L04-15 TaxID=1915318 RepID=UPI000998CA1B|nr:thiamine phosphate synthase [Thioclava sp. L04-15]OOY28586.1 thiamine phosphate synthase [Thioclava sp. L04-15]TNE91033.1 MAG: thiamine phosphate synthase [Paracoccaceae bacterium]TNF16881.1 MAG: thiamine phosphate synthase [Paracoccaceae bacterium]